MESDSWNELSAYELTPPLENIELLYYARNITFNIYLDTAYIAKIIYVLRKAKMITILNMNSTVTFVSHEYIKFASKNILQFC